MLPFFNTSGPCVPGEHYMLPPERRFGPVLALIEARRVFTLHAAYQTGKTTSLMWLDRHLNATGCWTGIWVDVGAARDMPDVGEAMAAILTTFDDLLDIRHPELPRPEPGERDAMLATPKTALLEYLGYLAAHAPHPVVVLFDEVDGLVGDALDSFLTQLRRGFLERSRAPFPASVALAWLGTSSPFNITAEATTLESFTEPEVAELLAQHTALTGQRFSSAAVDAIWQLASGHPWLTNALADQIVRRDVRDRSVEITAEHVEAAKETIILERRTHMAKLMADWQTFWRQHGHLAAGFHYREAGPHLMLMAFLQRVINGGGRIEREYGLGRWALDLLIEWRDQRYTIEVKLRRDTETEAEALDQLARYLDGLGLAEGWLVMFDLRSTLTWQERLTTREVEHRGKRIHIVGC